MHQTIIYKSIGIILTPFKTSKGMPIQAKYSNEKGKAVIPIEYLEATRGLEDFSHIILVYHFHKAKEPKLLVKPFLSRKELGLFAVRAPNRPNPIGISIVKLIEIIAKKNAIELIFSGADMLDQTPLLDIKPFVTDFDVYPDTKHGWYDKREIKKIKADNRFSKE
ncbi:MAG: tRNA (N6-threonylcarbamoyladenosine(37)-N6)-methyltransferase TrmO [Asgard group archaeon]|nr:tRNA (N6-threonylcarbamoyladenosine(37)-N6)-methyltransferase TrmO [Asgard group archaeon]